MQVNMSGESSVTDRRYEPGYRPVLIREDLKATLAKLRRELPSPDIYQERRLASALLTLALESVTEPGVKERVLLLARNIASSDIASAQ
jgi:hypothetical protein